MTTYHILARRDVLRALRFAPTLTRSVLETALAGGTVEALGGDEFNQIELALRLKRRTRQQALMEIDRLLNEYAFYVADAVVSEVAGDAVEAAVVEALGGSELAGVCGLFAGKVTEVIVGTEANKIRRDYEAHRTENRSWTFTRMPKRPAGPAQRSTAYLPVR